MDLFGDLPEPTSVKDKVCPEAANSQTSETDGGAAGDLAGDGITEDSLRQEKRRHTGDSTDPTCGYKRAKTVSFTLKGFVSEQRGERDEMQDAHVLLDNWHTMFTSLHPSIRQLSLYAVLDGHGGSRASRFACQSLPSHLKDTFPKGDFGKVSADIKQSFVKAYRRTDEGFLKEAAKCKPPWKDGTTAICAVAVNTVFVGNVGDSKAVLCRYSPDRGRCVGIPLSQDHNPSVYEERLRIQKAGGHVKDGRVLGVLEVSRSIGDGQYKAHGVSCLPDVKKCQLTPHDRFLLIGCDGLWKSFTVQESIDFVENILKTSDEGSDGDVASIPDTRFEEACVRLVSEAVLRLSADNVTVILVRIHQER